MGVASSSSQRSSTSTGQDAQPEGTHYLNILKPPKKEVTPEGKSILKKTMVQMHAKAKILRRISVSILWENFLCGPYGSFALTPAETASLLADSACQDGDAGAQGDSEAATEVSPVVKSEVAAYMELLGELTEKDVVKAIDIMAICSSSLLFSKMELSEKIDFLFIWMTLSGESLEEEDSIPGITFEMFYVSLASIDRGLSHAMGLQPCSEAYIRDIASQWFQLANKAHRPASDPSTRIQFNEFSDFCMNQQLPIRRLLEAFSLAIEMSSKSTELQEVVTSQSDDSHLLAGPSGGDEFMANPAWKKTAEKMVPKDLATRYASSYGDGISKPAATLKLEWVHGYRGFDCRNNVYYVRGDNQILFSAAGVSIVQEMGPNSTPKKQVFFGEHADDIISMDAFLLPGDQTLVATGEIGKTPAIHLYTWSANSHTTGVFNSLANISGFHKKGVAQLAFSTDGKVLLSISMEYSVAAYNSDSQLKGNNNLGKMIASSAGPKGAVFHTCGFGTPSASSPVYKFLSVGEKHYCVWTLTGGKLTSENGKLGTLKNKNMLSVARGPGELAVIGSAEGDLIIVRGVDVVFNHSDFAGGKSINALWAVADTHLIAGLKDGKILIMKWVGERLEVAARCSSGSSPIRAVSLSTTKESLLVGTQACEITELKLACGGPFTSITNKDNLAEVAIQSLVVGHYKDELWGLAVRPTTDGSDQDEFCTVGDDGYLRIWSISSHKQLFSLNMADKDMGGMARSCDYSPDGIFLAVAYGGNVGKGKNKEDGMVRVYRQGTEGSKVTLTKVSELKEAKQWISVIKFSPDGANLVVGSRDNSIYVYSVAQQFKRKAKFSKHNAGINQLDFTSCGRFIQSCCSGYEILFSEVNTGNQITNGATQFLEESWSTWTLTLGWPVMGIWKGDMDGSDINAVDRSPSGKYLATADDFGKVNLFRYPCVNTKCEFESFTGHSSHVTSVRWAYCGAKIDKETGKKSFKDSYLLSTGGGDKCVFQWRCEETGLDSRHSKAAAAVETSSSHAEASDSGFNLLDTAPTGGDEFTAVKAWLGAIFAPTIWAGKPDASKVAPFKAALGEFTELHRHDRSSLALQPNSQQQLQQAYDSLAQHARQVFNKMCESGVKDSSAPDEDELEIDWIHGYRGFDTRNNVRYGIGANSQQVIIYHAAAMGVVLQVPPQGSAKACKQNYFKGHKDDIMALATFTPTTPQQLALTGGPTTLVATGQQALAQIFVWSAATQQIVSSITTEQKSIHMLEFSVDGRLLVSIAEDKSVAVSDWKSQRMLVNTKGEAAVTFHIAASETSQTAGNFEFLSCGDKHIRYWTLAGKNLSASKISTSEYKGPKGHEKCVPQAFLCAALCNAQLLVGAEDGWVYITEDRKKITKAFCHHTPFGADKVTKCGEKGNPGSVTSIYAKNDAKILVTGAKDGSIVVWTTTGADLPTVRNAFALCNFDPAATPGANMVPIPFLSAKQIQSVCISLGTGRGGADLILVSTRGCDMLQLVCKDGVVKLDEECALGGGILARGHCNDELWGLATHPRLPEFCTAGDDKTLRFFNIHQKKMLASVPLGHISRAIAIHPEEPHVVALGFGGRVGKGKETGGGLVRVYSNHTDPRGSVKLCEMNNAKQWIGNVKFSSDGRTLVAGAHDNKIYIYNVNLGKEGDAVTCTLQLRTTFAKHNSVINHMDLSSDGRFMQSTCSAYELLFSDTSSGKQQKASELKDVIWDSFTCPLGWPVQGIWASGMDGSDINSVCRSFTGHVLATSDDFGKVNLFRYPCVEEGAKCNSYSGHSSHVMNVRWTVGDEYLISAGGNDKCAIVWKHKIAENANSGGSSSSSSSSSSSAAVSNGGGAGHDAVDGHGKAVSVDDVHIDAGGGGDDPLLGAPTGGDESGCVKPWLGAIKTPKHPPHINPKAPAVSMELSWVHGYSSGRSAANTPISANLKYNANKEIVFHAAALGVRLYSDGSPSEASDSNTIDMSKYKQQYYRGHDDDILCLAISPCRRFVATGQTASKATKGKGTVCVWDANDCRQLTRMDGCHQRGVNNVAFSPDGAQLLSVGMDDKNTHILWKDAGGGWSKTSQQASEGGDQNQVMFSLWVNPNNEVYQKDYQFITGGNSIQFWKIEGAKLSKKNGRFAKYKQCPLLCGANILTKDGWRIVTGTATGDVYVFNADKEVCNSFKAHEGPVLALAESDNKDLCSFIVSGGRDKTIKVWNHSLSIISSFTVSEACAPMDGSVAALDVCPAEANNSRLRILAGTQGGDIIEVISLAREGGAAGAGAGGGGGAAAGAAGAGIAAVKSITEAAEDVRNKDLSGAEAVALLHSHSKGELWGAATHPTNENIVATVGDDGALKIWSIQQQVMIANYNLQWPARCVCWHPSGHLLCVGFHEAVKGGVAGKGKKGKGKDAAAEGGAAPAKEGAVNLFTYHETPSRGGPTTYEIKKVAHGCSSTAWIGDVKFSTDGSILAVGSHDKHMYVFRLGESLTQKDGKWPDFSHDDPSIWADVNAALQKKPAVDFNKHSSAILHIDFSKDGKYTQTNCQAGELLFMDLATGKQEPSASKMADYQGVPAEEGEDLRVWDGQTCVLGWPVQGIWTPDKGLSDINACDKHHAGTLLATADDFGLVNIYRYPCVEEKSQYISLTGHSSHVTNVRWTASNALVSVGGNDKCVFVWTKIDK